MKDKLIKAALSFAVVCVLGACTKNYLDINSNPYEVDKEQIGIIYMEQGVISCNIPMGEPLAPLFHDFDTMIDEIKKSNVQNA